MPTLTSKDGTPITYDQSGHGPALILVGGASTTRADLAFLLVPALAPSFTVFAYDRRARGDSGDTRPYAVEREVEDIEALIDAAGGTAFVFGHSSGAILSLEAARLLPAKIAKLAVYEPPLIVDDSRSPAPIGFAAHLQEMVDSGRRGDAVEAFMGFVGSPSQMIAQMRESPAWPHMESLAQSLVYDATLSEDVERGRPEPLRKWAAVQVPTLVMDGTVMFGQAEAHTFMRTGADELARVLPHAQRRTLEGQDHGPTNEALVPVLTEFFLG